ncbi:MAG: efflux RND transporter periplasmic adaptor subunit [Cellvibrionales bacterium]|nr:efflux RND transporter periplasmic adaptor subunit [Cellvibrionales bacterium]
MKAWFKAVGFCLIVVVAFGAVKAFEIQSAIAMAESFPEPSETVISTKPEMATYQSEITLAGKVQASQKVTIIIELPGRITQVGFEAGKTIAKGQLLLKLDTSEEEAQLASAKARLTLAESIYKRHARLIKTNAVSQEQYEQATASLATVKAEITGLQSIISKKTLVAPFAGMAGLHQFEPGQFVSAGTKVTTIINTQKPYWVQFSLPAVYSSLTLGEDIQVALFGKSTRTSATLIAASPQVDSANLSTTYRAELTDYSGADNQPVSVLVPVGKKQEVVRVPVSALIKNAYGDWVYTLIPEEIQENQPARYRAKLTKVTLLNKGNTWAMLSKGLSPDQLIAGVGAYKLREGLLVYTAPESTSY